MRRINLALGLLAMTAATPALAQHSAHVHGLVRVDIAVDGPSLTVRVEAPLDSLVGFEHRPRTAAQRQAAAAALKQMREGTALLQPDAAAQCVLAETQVQADVLEPAAAAQKTGEPAPKGHGHGHAHDKKHDHGDEHADLEASYRFDCAAPASLKALDLGLFDAFKRIQRIQVQVAGPQGQSKQTLRRPAKTVTLAR